jgi:hypothetical protein
MYRERIGKKVMAAQAAAASASMAASATPLVIEHLPMIVAQPVVDEPGVMEVIPPLTPFL